MQYLYCKNDNFEDYACGRVIYGRAGMPNFPVRLSQEIYGRCLSYLKNRAGICVYDPCCGNGYLLTVLGLLNMNSIVKLIGSDIDGGAAHSARENLSLLTEEGLAGRFRQLEELHRRYGKASHAEAMESAGRFSDIVRAHAKKPEVSVFQADLLLKDVLKGVAFRADIVIADVPYGNLTSWHGTDEGAVDILLDNLAPVLMPDSVIAICSDKRQKIRAKNYRRLEKQAVGKRKFEILTLSPGG